MRCFTNMNIKIEGTRSQIDKIGNAVATVITDVPFEHQEKISIEDSLDLCGRADIEHLARIMVEASPEAHYEMEGRFDCSESSGEYMNFNLKYSDGKLTGRYSDWYEEEVLPLGEEIEISLEEEPLSLDFMISELEEFYECAGFEDYYERVLKNMNKEQITQHYKDTFFC